MANKSFQFMGFATVLSKAIKIPCRNPKLMLTLTLLWFLPLAFLSLGNQLALLPLTTDMASKASLLPTQDPLSSEYANSIARIIKDFRIVLLLESVFGVVSLLISLFAVTATVYSSAATLSGRDLTLKQLLDRIDRFQTLKRPLLTWFYVFLTSTGYVLLVYILIVGLKFVLDLKDFAFVASVVSVVLLAFVVYVYLSATWMLGLVISILEEDCYGFAAIGKASELIKGKKVQGFVLTLVLTLLTVAISLPFGWFMGNSLVQETWTRFAVVAIASVLFSLLKLLTDMAFTLLYFECKERHGEKVELLDGFNYVFIPVATHVNASLP